MAFARLDRRLFLPYCVVAGTGLAVVVFTSLYGIMLKVDGVVVLLRSIGMEPVPTVVPFEVSL